MVIPASVETRGYLVFPAAWETVDWTVLQWGPSYPAHRVLHVAVGSSVTSMCCGHVLRLSADACACWPTPAFHPPQCLLYYVHCTSCRTSVLFGWDARHDFLYSCLGSLCMPLMAGVPESVRSWVRSVVRCWHEFLCHFLGSLCTSAVSQNL
ncbi:uncharacterized protein K452DRAFT_111293 [Aplosporella prunicola CBS 121167]|uniref:Uncharacterized protein n=1 Tax=Aplosporella prunicola CBS 121167 TaxID=1176127 RepID=A0A6A6B1Z8_9PEZI|nr:uncharacterized protein K452DRAFT_111293 [Aplosporella prunicola CBS 121167]KAF2137285.1 hypothetical protein K452DRAFT_111293 [Aplosporella prunicola CBS 121167]